MKYNFKIDEKNNQLIVDVAVAPRGKLKNPRVTILKADVLQLVEEAFKPPKGTLLGDCLTNRSVYVDNYDLNRLTGCWLFELIKEQPTSKQTRKKSPRSKVEKS